MSPFECRGVRHLILGLLASVFVLGVSATSSAADEATPADYGSGSRFEAGISYLQWNEFLDIARGGVTSRGRATYVGPGLTVEYNRFQARWQYGLSATVASGKAASGGFSGGLTYPDGVDRLWRGFFLHPFFHYRVNPSFMIGAGALGRIRTIDWGSNDTTLATNPAPQLAGAPTLDLRWTIANKVTLIQSFALLGLNSETQWTWTAQYVF